MYYLKGFIVHESWGSSARLGRFPEPMPKPRAKRSMHLRTYHPLPAQQLPRMRARAYLSGKRRTAEFNVARFFTRRRT